MSDPSTSDLGPPLARGRSAEVYAWAPGEVLKLFHPEWRFLAEREAEVARAVCEAGLPVPGVGEVVEVAGRSGLVFENCEGPSLMERMQRRPWNTPRIALQLAELHVRLHSVAPPPLPPLRTRLADRVRAASALPEPLRERVLAELANRPDGAWLCHGDFHPGNVLATARGPVIIDWPQATRGDPAADVAQTSLLLTCGAPLPGTAPLWLRLIEYGRGLFELGYQRRYAALRPAVDSEVAAWRPLVAAARLSEDIPAERERLLVVVRGAFPEAG